MSLDVGAAAQLASLLEVSAPKPGNVSPGRHFSDTRYEDFLASAIAIGPAFSRIGTRPLGVTIRDAVESTSNWTGANTNLGIVLLLAPLALAVHERSELTGAAIVAPPDLRAAVRAVLQATTVEDARDVYAAIRRAAPGGLGRAEAQDVASDPDVTLLEAMRLAASRDDVAHEYATAFEITFTTGVPALSTARRDGLPWDEAVVETFLTLVAERPDTHIARRGGVGLARDVAAQARAVLAAGGVRSDAGQRAIAALDVELRRQGNVASPGTAADLTAAAIFVALVGGGWKHSGH